MLVGGAFIVAIGMGIVSPALPAFATSFNVGFTAVSFIVSAFAMMRLVFAPGSGRLVSMFGERPIYVMGLTIVGASSLACAFAADYWQLLVFRALGGVGSTMFTVSALGLLVRLAPADQRGRASGLWATSFLLGNISGPIVGGVLIGYSLRAPFVIYGLGLFFAAFVGWLLLRTSSLAARQEKSAAAMTVRLALGSRAYRASLLSNLSIGWLVYGARMSIVPLFVVEALHSTKSMAGFALSAFAVGNGVALTVAGRISDRRGRKPLVITGLAVSAVGTVALGFSPAVSWFLAASVLAGVGAGLLNPTQNAAVADILGTKGGGGGPVLAVFQMASDVGAIIGPLITGVLADMVSFQAAFAVAALTAVVALAAWVGAPETHTAIRLRHPAKPETAESVT